MRSFWLLFFGFLLVSSCSDLSKSDRLSRIDGFQHTIDSLSEQSTKFKSLDTTAYRTLLTDIFTIALALEDTLDRGFIVQLDSLKQINNSYSYFVQTSSTIGTVLTNTKARLKNLSDDIQNDRGRRDKYDLYIEQERQRLDTLCARFRDYSEAHRRLVRGQNPFLTNLKEELKELIRTEEQLLLD